MSNYLRAAFGVVAITMMLAPLVVFALETYEYPTIQGYGPVVSLPDAAVQPNPRLVYKELFDITTKKDAKDEAGTVNAGLSHVARFINAMDSADPNVQKQLAIIIHGPATPIVLKNDEYRKRFHNDNPNINLISALKAQGVTVYVCGQALRDDEIEHNHVLPNVTIALSALVVVPTLQLEGYAYQPFF